MAYSRDSIGARARKDTYAVKMAKGKWRLYRYSASHGLWVEGTRDIGYSEACRAVREAPRLSI